MEAVKEQHKEPTKEELRAIKHRRRALSPDTEEKVRTKKRVWA